MRFAMSLLVLSLTPLALAQSERSPIGERIEAAMQSEIRTEQERARDANRLPIETLDFFGLRSDMKVIELMPGQGWYTKLLAPVLTEGKLYLAVGTDRLKSLLEEAPPLQGAQVLDVGATLKRTELRGVFDLEGKLDFGVRDVDLVLTFRNLHNFTEEARRALNRAVFSALEPGGRYGVVDHTRRHMEPASAENWRRIDPLRVTKEALEAGFKLVAFSDLHHRPDDELRYEVGRRTVTGNTDRFTLLFEKPR